ncbi:hypothetical protein [Actinophytocola glycyrrhizae]|uniref:Uncharacterized protein n=1 Tax=Actinophytocola glycyrrhizae TaxID=2044873 RepID=A0ABV9SA49_9PSEU
MAHRKSGQSTSSGGTPPAAGHFLLAGIDAVLPRLTPPATATPQLVDDLRTALARTAARGETCRVAAAANDVRLASNLLLAGATDEAREALRHARTALSNAAGGDGPFRTSAAGDPPG